MPELRKDFVTDTWVIIAPVRSQRPGAALVPSRRSDVDTCPFCEGREAMTPPETFAIRDASAADGPGWHVRCVPNRFPALEREGTVERGGDLLHDRVTGVGTHEVIVESPRHGSPLPLLGDEQLRRIVRAYRERYRELAGDPRHRYILLFKNHGERAGASISHPHSQLIGMPIVPQRIREELDGADRFARSNGGACVFCRVVETEESEGRRIVAGNASFLALSPYAARFPFETWILPRRHAPAFEHLPDADVPRFSSILKDVLGRLFLVLNDPDLNYYIHTAPCGDDVGTYHWHVEITPRLAEIAGFERGTGMFINQVMPEDAASILRGSVRAPEET